MTDKLCTNCAYCVHAGTGYSEYTILGEDLICMKKYREDFDTEYATDAQVDAFNKIAEGCPHFVEGEGPRLGLYSDDEEKDLVDWSKQTGLAVPPEYA